VEYKLLKDSPIRSTMSVSALVRPIDLIGPPEVMLHSAASPLHIARKPWRQAVHDACCATCPAQEGYLQSWSAHATYLREHPDRPDPIIKFKADFMRVRGFSDDSQTFSMEWPLFVILAKGPRSL
jgi:hypothetical protein